MSRHTKRKDMLRLRSLMLTITEPFQEMEHMGVEDKLVAAFRPKENPIYRRKILRTMQVNGAWWMDDEQWVRFLWAGHKASVIKNSEDENRVITTRSFEPNGFCYIRSNEKGGYDLEALSRTTAWDKEKKKRIGTVREWMTVSITEEEYKKLQPYLGEVDAGCKHHRLD